jgi:DNA invertase Pin-like site-specific DNA recombinase
MTWPSRISYAEVSFFARCFAKVREGPVKLGYARVSTDDQTLDRQRERLREAGCERLFEEKVSGARRDRPELARLLDQLRGDDVVVVTRLDRLARSTSNLLEIAEAIRAKEAGLLSLAEPWADTTSPAGRMVLTVFAGIAEFERELIRQRTEEGRQAARKRGVSFGRPPKLRPDQRELAARLLQEGRSVSEVARTFNVHPATIYRCIEMPVLRPRPKAS